MMKNCRRSLVTVSLLLLSLALFAAAIYWKVAKRHVIVSFSSKC